MCAKAVVLRWLCPELFWDLPENACELYPTWMTEHKYRFVEQRKRIAPDQPAAKRRRRADSVNPQ